MKALVERAIALRIDHQLKAASLGVFKQVLLHDATSFAVHRRLAADFPGRFKTISPAAIECHMTVSLSEQSADTAGSGNFFLRPTSKPTACYWLTRVTLTGPGLNK